MHFTLDSTNIQRALEILDRERQVIQPTRWELRFFRIFQIVTYVFAAAVAGFILASAYEQPDAVVTSFFAAAIATFIATVPLFFLNLRLMRKLWRHARLRRKLELTQYLKTVFRRRRRGRFGNILAIVAGLFGAFLLIISVTTGVLLPIIAEAREIIIALLFGVIPMAIVGASLISLYFMRRAKQKLDALDALYASVKSDQGETSLGSDDYYRIADIEREQIIRERTHSITESQKKTRPAYVVQTSREARLAKAQLNADTSNRIDQTIFELTTNPGKAGTPETAAQVRRVEIPGTEMSINYQVDEQSKRIRIFALESSAKEKAGEMPV